MRMTAFWSLLKRYQSSEMIIVEENRADGFDSLLSSLIPYRCGL